MAININIPEERNTMIPKITVLGIGGAGGNAVNNMISSNLQGVHFMVANTDAQALTNSKAEIKQQLGQELTKGLGAGSSSEIGQKAAEESKEEILSHIKESNMVFITAGMGGGTGTGAAPAIAKMCKENGILTVGVATKPFHFEGSYRMKVAEKGVEELQKYVDTLIIIPNQNLFHKATEKTTFAEAFSMVDNVLYSGVKGITDLMTMPGLINLDFADINTIMNNMGKAMMGTGEAEGEKRALEAAEAAISNPLLDNASMKGAKGVLINISGGLDMTLFEADEAAQRVKDEVDSDANIIFGSTFDKDLDGKIRVSVVATGIGPESLATNANNFFSKQNIEEEKEEIKQEISNEEEDNQEYTFIPSTPVTPEDLSENENIIEEAKESIEENNLKAEQEEAIQAENTEPSNEPTVQITLNEVEAEKAPQIELNNNNITEDSEKEENKKTESKITKSLGGIFSFFKDNNEDYANEEKESNDTESKSEDDQDLTVSEDILNVPTFIRNNKTGTED